MSKGSPYDLEAALHAQRSENWLYCTYRNELAGCVWLNMAAATAVSILPGGVGCDVYCLDREHPINETLFRGDDGKWRTLEKHSAT